MTLNWPDVSETCREGMAFSNGTEWEMWSENWCERCVHDSPALVDQGKGCPLIMLGMTGFIPAEWMEQPEGSPDRYHCIQFRDEDDGPGPEPQPKPEPSDMDGLFPRPERRVRMLSQPQVTEVTA